MTILKRIALAFRAWNCHVIESVFTGSFRVFKGLILKIFLQVFPIIKKDQDKKDRKKGGCPEKKRPSPPYILWCKDQWNEVKKENPEADFKEISNILGAKWKNVRAEEKKSYEEKYQADKDAYLQAMAKDNSESEAMKLLEDDHKQKTAMELLDQYLLFKHDAEKENKKTK